MEHEGLERGVAAVEGQGEDTGMVPPGGPQGFPGPVLSQKQGQKVLVGEDLKEKMEEECYFSGCPPNSIVFGQIFCFSEGLLRHTDSFLAFMLIVTVLISHCLMRDTDTQRGWVT